MRPSAYPTAALAGRAEMTLRNPATGQHVKVKFRQKKDRLTGKPGDCYFVYVALLNDGKFGYEYAGAYFKNSRGFKLSAEHAEGSRMAAVARFLIDSISNTARLETLTIDNANRCCSCGRKLTHPDSIHTWLGPECFASRYGKRTPEKIRLHELGHL